MFSIKNFVLICFVALCFGHYSKAAVVDEIVLTLRGTTNQNYNVNNFATVLTNANFNATKKTVLWLYGLTQLPSSSAVKLVVDAYQQNGNYNFILVSMPMIRYVFSNIGYIGEAVCQATNLMFAAGLKPEDLHIVGFSLGAQTAGVIGRCILKTSNGEKFVGRITGLDSAIFDIVSLMITGSRLGQNDAAFVDTIHTNSGGFGGRETYGDVNFWVNGGLLQPSCANSISILAKSCSHSLAYTYWAESVRSTDPNIFEAKQCQSWTEFTSNTCNATAPIGYMGLYASNTLRKNYYLSTNLASPYSI
ncbi:unnamed protein product [Diamesa hyperborea]